MTLLFAPDDDSIVRIHDQLARLLKMHKVTAFSALKQPLTRQQLSVLIETMFWASLRSDEGRTTRVCVAVATHESSPGAITLATPVAYNEAEIAKLAPAVPPGGCLLVSVTSDAPAIWGFARSRPHSSEYTVTIEVSEPGTVRVSVAMFEPFAVLDGRSNPIVAGTSIDLPHYFGRVLKKTLATGDLLETQAVWRECFALAELARMILSDGHGGLVLIVPNEVGGWSESLTFAYRLAAPDKVIRDAIRLELKDNHATGEVFERMWETDIPLELKNLISGALTTHHTDIGPFIRSVASLAAVDGAIVMTPDLRVLGFGAKITVKGGATTPVSVSRADSGEQEAVRSSLESLGGTRHQSAARFIAAHTDSVALVISQDRHISIMNWDESTKRVDVVSNAEWRL